MNHARTLRSTEGEGRVPPRPSDERAPSGTAPPDERVTRPSQPSVSVAMAAFNGERHIGEQLASIFHQSYPVDQLVIVDDASTDATPSILRAHDRDSEGVEVVIVSHTTNRGVRASFEEALRQTVGDVVFLADQDDVWARDKVERCVRAWATGDAHVLMHDFEICDRNLKRTGFRGRERNSQGPHSSAWSFQGMAMYGTGEFFRACIPFGTGHDTWIGLIGRITERVQDVPDVLAMHRRHDHNVTGRVSRFGPRSRRFTARLQAAFNERLLHRERTLDAYIFKYRRAVDTLLRLRDHPSLFQSPAERAQLAAAIEQARETRRIATRRSWVARGSLATRLRRAVAVSSRTRPRAGLALRYVRDALIGEPRTGSSDPR